MRVYCAAMLLTTLLLSSCASVAPHRTVMESCNADRNEKSSACSKSSVERYSNYSIAYVELTDMGLFHRRDQLKMAMDLVQQSEKEGPTHVVVFVHGWKHSAAYADSDVVSFATTAMPVMAKNFQLGKPGTKTIGIFVGWRGTPLLGFHDLSFHDRKASADHVAKGSLRELLGQLRAIRSGENPKTKVTLVGHSFGSLILFSAISGSIIDSISDANLRNSTAAVPLNPIYDAAVLLNPAFEAIRFEPLFQAAKAHRIDSSGFANWSANQKPLLVSITSKEDGATKNLFPFVRFFNSLFQRETITDQDNHDGDSYPNRVEKLGNNHTIGHLPRYITHSIGAAENSTNCDEASNLFVRRPNQFPLWNMSASPALIPDHNKIYDKRLWSFISSLSASNVTGQDICSLVSEKPKKMTTSNN